MGVPGFFKWLSLRYPHIIETVKKTPRSKTDFLYLDINALFHVAIRKKATSKKHQTPRRVLAKVFNEMDTAFNICEPQILVYIAMDGVAPRAKMNEQRSRRYLVQDNHISDQVPSDSNNVSSSESSDDNSKNGKGSGFFVPVDSVSISAGTSFMQSANEAIKYYIYQRLNGKKYRNLQIIFNDSNVAGEGEHKIFQFLNAQRKQPGYKRKFRHTVCGGDADFIMYALLTHEPNLRILRPGTNGKDVVLNINKLRKHIVHDMVVPQLTAEIDEENIIEDFVCIVNLLGNDFLPRITYLRETRVDLLFQAYQNYFNESRTYIIRKGGFINIERFLRFIKFLGEGMYMSNLSFASVGNINSEVAIRANDYVKTICWTLQYYSGDCPSWKFYYSHHKSPSIQDILNYVHAEDFDQTFKEDTPMRPFEQLMCIIPPVCNYLLPEPFRGLLTDPESPIIEYYPKNFNCSNSKAILPFVDEKVLSQAMAPQYSLLNSEDACRDRANGVVQIFAGRESPTYATIYSLCMAKDGKFVFPAKSDFFGQLFHDGQMRISVDSPINEWNKIYPNSVVNAKYKLPNVPKNSSFKDKKSLLLTNITHATQSSTNKYEELLNYQSSSSLCSNKNELKSKIISSIPEEQSNARFLTTQFKVANTEAQLQPRSTSVYLIPQHRNYGTVPNSITNTSRPQTLVDLLGLSESHRGNVIPQAKGQNRMLPTEFVADGRYVANRDQTNERSNNQGGQFNYFNNANYYRKY
ncbi:XRN 5'-3' exonuclease N-terminus-domain-containing protein [Glomus cerebriforme]|uniref:XRN 5'-3' exonuclease N-terminus-domain-containing protein n=1 Tax=Glomus cerebriforme TaxID=658196 RepID=A0A397T3R9_9GLOM|nr:XRN 5'-3' exonuclease N-terminus-domain-containing protein [Glomus cerebriforme]